MRHYVAVQDAEGRWWYANEGRSRVTGLDGWTPSGACSPTRICPDCDPFGFRGPSRPSTACLTCNGAMFVPKASPCTGHDTAAEAYEHERQRLLDERLTFHDDFAAADTLKRCKAPDCGAFTSGRAYVGSYRSWVLCADHRNRKTVEPLFCVGESWES
jgi:hypothetical protein